MILALLDAAEAGDLRYYIVTYPLKKFRGEIQTKKLFRQIAWVVVYISKNIQIMLLITDYSVETLCLPYFAASS